MVRLANTAAVSSIALDAFAKDPSNPILGIESESPRIVHKYTMTVDRYSDAFREVEESNLILHCKTEIPWILEKSSTQLIKNLM